MESKARRTARTGRSLRRSSRTKKRGGGGFGSWWRPPKAGEPLVPILLFKGKYRIKVEDSETREETIIERPYGILCSHFSKPKMTSLICSAGLSLFYENGEEIIDAGDGACVPCHYAEENGEGGGVGYARKIHIFNGILMADFHKVKSDKPAKSTGKHFDVLIPCKGKRCPHCRSGKEKVFGKRVYWELGTGFVEQLADHDLITLAGECRCGGKLEPVGFVCAKCGTPYVDLEKEEVADEELQNLREQENTCPKCGHVDFLEEVSECDQCMDPHPLSMWNTVMEIFRSGERAQTSLVFSRNRPVTEEELEKVKDLMEPVDLKQTHRILSLADQARKFDIENPFPNRKDRREGKGSADYPQE